MGRIADETRSSITTTTHKSNVRSFTYGVTTAFGYWLYNEIHLEAKLYSDLSYVDYMFLASNIGYGYGYGAPYLIEGQLKSPDPGCGSRDLYQGLSGIFKDYDHVLRKTYKGLDAADGSKEVEQLLENGLDDIPQVIKYRIKGN